MFEWLGTDMVKLLNYEVLPYYIPINQINTINPNPEELYI